MSNQAVFVRGALALAVATAFVAPTAFAGGFQIKENSAAALGRAFAGSGAAPGDAAIVSNNPAGMRLLGGRVVQVDVSAINLGAEFEPRVTSDAAGQPLTGGDGGDAGDLAFVPAAYFAMPIGEQFHLGAYLDAPFGLKTEYDDGWVGRYNALKSELRTIDAGVSLAWDINPYVSFGASVFYQHIDAELTSAIDFGALAAGFGVPGFAPQSADGSAKIEGDDGDIGWKVGALFSVTDTTHLGLTYRSKVEHTLEGDATFGVPGSIQPLLGLLPGNLFSNTGGSADFATPAVATVSFYTQANDQWAFMADVSRTAWSSFERLTVEFDNVNQPPTTEDFFWRDTWFASVGTEYRMNEQWMLRGGLGYDQTPTQLATRSPRVPDADRRWLSLGATYQASEQLAVNVGYTHLFLGDPEITARSSTGSVINGNYDSNVDILAASVSYRF